jgi:alpha/beta superfamily hydrolase
MEPVTISTPRGDLFGAYHAADGNDLVVVVCPPFGEEKKTSYRVLYEQAEALAASGVPVLRFDYYGTGDSEGDFRESTVGRWIEDVASASEFALSRSNAQRLCLLGLRLGGSIAACCRSDRLVLWQPLTEPGTYLKANIKRQALRQKLIGGAGPGAGEMDGYVVTDELSRSIRAMKVEIVHSDCFLVQVSYTEKVLSEYAGYREREGVEFRAVRLEPFWQRLGRVDARSLIDLTTEWIVRS